MSSQPSARILAALRDSGLAAPPARVLALLSGGADSVCLVHALARELGPGRVEALHVHHGLRAAADEDESFCRQLCEALEVPLHVERVQVAAAGSLEARAREARYAAAEA